MEQEGKTLYTGKRLYDYADVDTTREDLLKYFKNKYIPNFPERNELSTAKLVKAARDFYAKKGTPEALKFLFRVFYGQEVEVYFPKEDILRASDGKWKLPQALRLAVSDTLTLLNGNVSVVNVASDNFTYSVDGEVITVDTVNIVTANSFNLVSSGITANSYISINGQKRKVTAVNAAGDFLVTQVPFVSAGNNFNIYAVTVNPYENFNFNLLERRKGVGELSRTTCVIESAVKTVDKDTGREIVELYISNVRRPFQVNENLLVDYVDPSSNSTLTFSSKIISLISGISLARNRLGVIQNGQRYVTGDPVILFGGLNTDSADAVKAVATVGNVTTAQIENITLTKRGYLFRDDPNSLVQIQTSTGIGAKVIISQVSEDPTESANVEINTDSIYFKKDVLLSNATYQFDNFTFSNINTSLALAFSTQNITMGRINTISLIDTGSLFDQAPTFAATSVYDTDFTETLNDGMITIPAGQFSNYNRVNNTIQLNQSNAAYSTSNGLYTGARLFLDTGDSSHYVTVIDYVVNDISLPTMTKTLYLDRDFESNINDVNIQNYNLMLDLRADVHNLGKLAAVEIANGGIGYSSTDQIVFVGSGHGATGTLTVSGGIITGVTLTNRGEGYYGGANCVILDSIGNPSTGTGADLFAYELSDGELITAEVGELGQILDFDLINRGYDYSTAPVVSLKVADILTDNLSTSAIVLNGTSVWQGGSTNANSTFNGVVDSVYRTGSQAVIRVFNYNGNINVAQGLLVNTSTGNATVNIQVANAIISFDGVNPATERSYPKFYGDGLAKANAEFLSGLIKYEGFYLNTDGFLSADKKLQNNNYFHNFSYEVQSEKSLDEYKEALYRIAHPAGMQLLSKYLIKDSIDDKIKITSGVDTSDNTAATTVNAFYTGNLVFGNSSDFANTANVGDLIVINSSNNAQNRIYTRLVTNVDGPADQLTIESPIGGLGDGKIKLTANSATAFIYGNTEPVSQSLVALDPIGVNIGGTDYSFVIGSISGNTLTLTSASAVSGNVLYNKLPSYFNVDYKIIKSNG
jgi:hypothetical protein